MAAINSTTSGVGGNWSATSTWSGGVVPKNGDTVVLTRPVVVDVNTTVGASNGNWASGGNPAAIQLGTGGTLTIAAGVKLTCRGDLYANTGFANVVTGLTLNAGSIFEFDASQEASPFAVNYRFFNNTGGFVYGLSLVANGAQANPCYFQSNVNGGNGGIVGTSAAGNITATWCNFLRIGTATMTCWYASFNVNKVNVSITNCTFDTCGQIGCGSQISSANGTATFTNVLFINSLGANFNSAITAFATYTNVVFDVNFGGAGVSPTTMAGATFQTCFFFDMVMNVASSSLKWATFTNNFFRTMRQGGSIPAGDVSNTVWVFDQHDITGVTNNPHYCFGSANFNVTFNGIIFECTDVDNEGDCFLTTASVPASTVTMTMKNSLHIPNCVFDNPGTPVTHFGVGAPKPQTDYQHGTYLSGIQGWNHSETGAVGAGSILNFKSNIAWDYPAYNVNPRGWLISDDGFQASPVQNAYLPANADRNCKWNVLLTTAFSTTPGGIVGRPNCTGQANGYISKLSGSPGVHDLNGVNPMFVDTTRNTPTFDTVCLGNVAPSTWASHGSTDTFTVGQIVSNNNAGYYGATVVNFRCIQTHVKSTASSEPGSSIPGGTAATWRQYWELASLQSIRNGVAQGANGLPNTFSNTALQLSNVDAIKLLWTWIRAGFAPQNTSLRQAGTDGQDIGAVPCVGAYQHNQMMMGCC
jgi:hypothetical protein